MSFFKLFDTINYNFMNTKTLNICDYFVQIIPEKLKIDDYIDYDYYQVVSGERPDQVSYKLYGTTDYYWTFWVVNEHLRDVPNIWRLSNIQFEKYITDHYSNKMCISLKPKIERNLQGTYLRTTNTVSVDFSEGDILTGIISNASGKLISKENDLQQLIVEMISDNPFQENELISSNNSMNQVISFKVYNLKDAPYNFYEDDRVVQNPYLINGEDYVDYAYKTYYEYEYEENDKLSKIKVIKPNVIQSFVNDYKKLIEGNLV